MRVEKTTKSVHVTCDKCGSTVETVREYQRASKAVRISLEVEDGEHPHSKSTMYKTHAAEVCGPCIKAFLPTFAEGAL